MNQPTSHTAQNKATSTGIFSRRNRISMATYVAMRAAFFAMDCVLLLPLLILATVSRFKTRPIDVGLGPVPLINNVYHKRALQLRGYSAETFVDSLWTTTNEFDHKALVDQPLFIRALAPYYLMIRCFFQYKCVYIYFTGGPLRLTSALCYLEPYLFTLAGIKTVAMPFGSDVNVLTRTPNLLFKHGIGQHYPGLRLERRRTANLIDTWTAGADCVIGGCDWVDYLYHWDHLMLAHFSIDLERWKFAGMRADITDRSTPLKVLHAPNHRALKGTDALLNAIEELKADGVNVELQILEGVPNEKVRATIASADVVMDQLVIGAYAMFALEAMSTGKPTICYMRQDLEHLFIGAGIVKKNEIPLVRADIFNIADVLRDLEENRDKLAEIGNRSRKFVETHHSLEAISLHFDEINQRIGLQPSSNVS